MKNGLIICALIILNVAHAQDNVNYSSGYVTRVEYINCIQGFTVSSIFFESLNLNSKEFKSGKKITFFNCNRIFDNQTGILLYGDLNCVDTILRIIWLKADLMVNNKYYKSKEAKTLVLSQIKEDEIKTIENIQPGEIYKGKTFRKGLLRINLKNAEKFEF